MLDGAAATAELPRPSGGGASGGAAAAAVAVPNGPMPSPASLPRLPAGGDGTPFPPHAQSPKGGAPAAAPGNSPSAASTGGVDSEWLRRYEELKAVIAEPVEVKEFVRGQLERVGGAAVEAPLPPESGGVPSRRGSNVVFVDLADPAHLPDDFHSIKLCGKHGDMHKYDEEVWHTAENKGRCGYRWRRSRFNNAPMLDHELSAEGCQPALRCRAATFHLFFYLYTALTLFDPSKAFFVVFCVFSTWVCIELDWSVDVNPTIFVSSIVFPLALSVNSAYSRREAALSTLATMRACALSLFDNQRAWREACKLPHLFVQESGHNILLLFHHTDRYLRSHHNEACKLQHMWRIYGTLDSLMDDIEVLRRSGLSPPLVTRPIHELQQLIIAFENLRSIADYRTPSTIRAYARLAVFTISLLLGTYWSNMVNRRDYSMALCLVLASFFPSFFLALITIQEQLEEPFGRDIDDIVMGPPRSITLAVEKATLLARLEKDRAERRGEPTDDEGAMCHPRSIVAEFESLLRTQSAKVLTGGTGT